MISIRGLSGDEILVLAWWSLASWYCTSGVHEMETWVNGDETEASKRGTERLGNILAESDVT